MHMIPRSHCEYGQCVNIHKQPWHTYNLPKDCHEDEFTFHAAVISVTVSSENPCEMFDHMENPSLLTGLSLYIIEHNKIV